MSQWGAKGQADAGRSAEQILSYYYQGTSIAAGTIPDQVRVGVLWDLPAIEVAGTSSFQMRYGGPEGEQLAAGSQSQSWTVSTDSSGNLILTGGDQVITRPGGANSLFVIYGPQGSLLRLPQTGNRYKYGSLQITSYLKDGAWLVRGVIAGMSLTQYLYGLGEVPSAWPEEALKAQAIAARTYAVEKIGRLGQSRQPCDCGLYPSTIDQVYIGFEKEAGPGGDRWRSAVDSTDGRVLTFNGKPIEAVYHSSSGGYTENNEFVWGGPPLPYLRGVPDPWDASPRRSWTMRLTQQDLASRLNSNPDTAVGGLASIEILDPAGVSGRVRSVLSPTQGGVRITGPEGIKRVSGAAFKKALGLLSTLFWQGEPRLVGAASAVTVSPVPGPSQAPAIAPAANPGPATAPATAPAPAPAGYPDGTLVKGSGPKIFLIQEGAKHPLGSPGALASRFPKASPVILADDQLARYPDGPQIGYRDGTVISQPGKPVWLITGGKRRRFASALVLTRSGYPQAQIRKVSPSEVAMHPEGPPITNPAEAPFDGTLIKGSGPAVYLVEAGKKRPIPSLGILESRFTWKDVVMVKQTVLTRFPTGAEIGFAEGALIRNRTGEIFVISNGKRRAVSPERFAALNYQAARVQAATDREIQAQPLGDPL